MAEEDILNSLSPDEIVEYIEIVEECTTIVEKFYAEERALFNNKTKLLYDDTKKG